MKKKVLHIVEAFGGGVFTFLISLANSQCEKYDVTIAYALRPQTPEHFERFLSDKIHLIKVENFARSISGKQDVKAFLELRKILKEVMPDILHLHSSKAGFLGRMAVTDKKCKVFYTPHGFAFLKQDDSALKRMIYYDVERFAAWKCPNIIGVSKGEMEAAKPLTRHAWYVNNGINVALMPEPKEPVFDLDQLVVGTSGRVCFQKNPTFFNNVAEAFLYEKFIWIGEGELQEELTSQNIEITGWKQGKETLLELEKLDIFLLTSRWEGMPVSLLEAMYMNKICVVTDVIGNNDVIRHGENGFLIHSANDAVLILQEIMNGKWDLVKIANQAHADVLKYYTVEKMCESYMEIYECAR